MNDMEKQEAETKEEQEKEQEAQQAQVPQPEANKEETDAAPQAPAEAEKLPEQDGTQTDAAPKEPAEAEKPPEQEPSPKPNAPSVPVENTEPPKPAQEGAKKDTAAKSAVQETARKLKQSIQKGKTKFQRKEKKKSESGKELKKETEKETAAPRHAAPKRFTPTLLPKPESRSTPGEEKPKKVPRPTPHMTLLDQTIQAELGAAPDTVGENDPNETKKKKKPITVLTEKQVLQRKHRRRMFLIIGIVIVVAIALILWMTIPNSGASRYANNGTTTVVDTDVLETHEGFPVSISGTEVDSHNFFTQEKDLVYVSDTSVVRLKQNAEEVYARSHSFFHPIARSGGNYVMVYNVGSVGYRVEDKSGTVREETTEENMMAADVAENGRYAIVTETKGYASSLKAYLSDGSLQFTYSFTNCYVEDIALSADGSRAAVIGLTAQDGQLVSEVYLFNFNQEKPVAFGQFTDTLLLGVEYCDGTALAVGDNLVACVSEKGEQFQYVYENRKLAAYAFDENRVLVGLSPYDSSTSSQLVVINAKGEAVCTRNTQETYLSVSLYGDTMAGLSRTSVSAYSVNAVKNYSSKDGEEQSAFYTAAISEESKAIALADESSLYVLGINEIRYQDF